MKSKHKYLSLLFLSLFLFEISATHLIPNASTAPSAETIFNFFANNGGGVTSTGGVAHYTYINGPIGTTAGYLLTEGTGQYGYIILNNSIVPTYGVYTIQALMVNSSTPPADSVSIILGSSTPFMHSGGMWPSTVSTNGVIAGIEFYPGTVNGYTGPALYIYTSSGLALWYQLSTSDIPSNFQTFTLMVGVTSSEIWIAYFIGNQLIANVTAYTSPSFSSDNVEVLATTGGSYAGFLVTQVAYYENVQIATIQNEISMALNYLLDMGIDCYGEYTATPEYATPSVAFEVINTSGMVNYFIPGSYPNVQSSVFGTNIGPLWSLREDGELVGYFITDNLVEQTTNEIQINYTAYGIVGNVNSRTGTIQYVNVPIFSALETVYYSNPQPGVYDIQLTITVNNINSNYIESVTPYLSSGATLDKVGSNEWEFTYNGQYFYPLSYMEFPTPNSLGVYTIYPNSYLHAFRITVRHVQEMMTMLSQESQFLYTNYYTGYYDTVYQVQSAVGVWGLNGNEPVSYYASLFGYAWQPNLGTNFYDAINNNFPTYYSTVLDEFYPYAYAYKSGLVVINPNIGGDDWAKYILNGSVWDMTSSYSIGFGGGFFDPLAVEMEGLYYFDKGQYSTATNYFNDIYNYYLENHGLYWAFVVYYNGQTHDIYTEGANDTLRLALAVALGSDLASKGYVPWSEVQNLVNILTQLQWQGKGYAEINGQVQHYIDPLEIGGFMTGYTKVDPVFATARPGIINEVVKVWGTYGGPLSGGPPEEDEYKGLIVANAETTIISVQALAMYLQYMYNIPLSYSLNPLNAYLVP